MLEHESAELRAGMAEVDYRLGVVGDQVNKMSAETRALSARTYEVRNRAGKKIGMTVMPAPPAVAVPAGSPSLPAVPPMPAAPTAVRSVPGNSSPVLTPPAGPASSPKPTGMNAKLASAPRDATTSADALPPAPALPPESAPAIALPPETDVPAANAAKKIVAEARRPASAQAPSVPAAKGEESAYKAALALATSGRPAESREKFQEFLEAYPSGRYAPNAYYWIGETLYSQRNYPEALMQFKEVTSRFPTHHKSADALLKAGMTYQRMGDKENADLHFKALLSDFPNSDAARLAQAKGWGR